MSATAQQKDPAVEPPLPTVSVSIKRTVSVPSVAGAGMVRPFVCASDGTIFVRMATGGGVGDLQAISPDGKSVIILRRADIRDIPSPRPAAFFVTDSNVYLLVNSTEAPQKKTRRWRTPDGKTLEQTDVIGIERQHVARFSRDGQFLSSTRLDIPFRASQIGVFANDTLLLAGRDLDTGEPRIALADSRGQFNRYLALEGDIEPENKDLRSSSKYFGDGRGALEFAIGVSQLVAYGRNILLVRTNQTVPLFEISPGGTVRPLQIKIPTGFRISIVIPSIDRLFVTFSKPAEIIGLEFLVAAIDPMTGSIVDHYVFSERIGGGLVCASGDGMTFVRQDRDKSLLLLTGVVEVPATRPEVLP